jgi:hypothetical protein
MPLGLNILICGEGKRLPIRNLDRSVLIVRVNGAKPMIAVGDDNLRVGGISYQQQRRQLLFGLNFLLVFIDVRIAHSQEWQTR